MASVPPVRALRRALATGLVVAGVALLPTSVAAADPVVPADASQAEQQLARISTETSALNEQVLRSRDDLAATQAAARTAQDQVTAAQDAVARASAEQSQYQGTVDDLAAATYQGARLNKLSALVLSRSPQELLDQMSALDVLATDTNARVDAMGAATTAATAAADRAAAAARAATDAAAAAQRVEADLTAQQADLADRATAVRAQFDALTPTQRASYAGTTTPAGYTAPAGTGVGGAALAAALTKVGSPYEWGATGPDSFDCSGLVQWAYQQAGVSLPRTSQAQGGVGVHVDPADLQPGDIITFYGGATHVGIYAGDGNVVHASDYGIPVKVAPMGSMPINDARRV